MIIRWEDVMRGWDREKENDDRLVHKNQSRKNLLEIHFFHLEFGFEDA